MNEKVCFFIGHRDTPDAVFPLLKTVIIEHIERYGVHTFIVGSYGAFDKLATKALIDIKQLYPGLTLLRLAACHPSERDIKLPEQFDGIFYPLGLETVPRKFAIVRANRYAADHADYLIAYAWHAASNARELLEYAKRRNTALITELTKL